MKKIKDNIKKVKKDAFWGSLFKNSFWAFLGDSAASLIGLIVTIILIRLIGSDSYGILVLGQSYMQIVDVIINVQSWKSVIQYGQKALVRNKIDELNSYVKLGTILDVSTALLCGVVALLLAPLIGGIFGWSSELVLCAQIFSISIFSHFSGTTIGILRIFDKFSLVALQKFIAAMLKVVALIVVMIGWSNVSLLVATIIYVAADIVGNIILVVLAYYQYHKRYGLAGIFKSKLPLSSKQFISFTLWGTLSEVVDVPVNYIDVFIVSILGDGAVAVYKVFKQLAGVLQKVTSPIQQSILPQFSQLSAEGSIRKGYDVVIKIRNFSLRVILPIAIVVGITSKLWLGLVYGELYAEQWYVFLMYIVVQAFALSYTTIHPYFLSLNEAKRSALYVFVANTVYFIVALLLVPKIGLVGIVISFAVQVWIVIFAKVKRIMKLSINKIVKNKVIIIGGNHHNALGVVRSLGLEGIYPDVIITSNTRFSYLKKSKYIRKYYIVKEDKKEILSILDNKYNEEKYKPILIPTSDFAALLIDEEYNKLNKKYILPSIDDKQGEITKIMNKYSQIELAQKYGIKVINTHKIKTDSTKDLPKLKKYPYIMKPLISAENGSKENMRICRTSSDIKEALDYAQREGFKEVILQEYINYEYELDIPGCCYGDQLIIPAVVRKLRRYPEGNGVLSYAELIKPSDEVKDISNLLKDIKLFSLFDLELFRTDDGFVLNEINFRNSGNSFACTRCGVNLPYIYTLFASGNSIGDLSINIEKEDVFFRDENGERKQLRSKKISWDEYRSARKNGIGLVFYEYDRAPDIYKWPYAVLKRLIRR